MENPTENQRQSLARRDRGTLKRSALGAGLILLLVLVASRMENCQGLPTYVANCPVTPNAPQITSKATPAPQPPLKALCAFPMTISSPTNGQTVQSPFHLLVNTQAAAPIYNTRVYVDGKAVLFSFLGSLDQYIWAANGNHTIEVVSEDQSGYIATQTVPITVSGQNPGLSQIQNLDGWINCSSVLATGAVCAAGLGTAKSALEQSQTSPTLNGGTSSKFAMEGGTHAYSNALYWLPLGGGNNVSHFTFDLWFYIDNGKAPQALEFDVNQTFGGTRWTWGSECSFNGSHKWDIWNDAAGVWVDTDVPCNDFPSNTWIHLIWSLERVGNQVHYISLNVADSTYTIDQYFTAQSKWYADEIDVAFQMDGNFEQEPYNVWLDQVTLNAY
ncbi:MAG TPA: hypothetical protein VMG31_16605 [Verrucomicrobiae bacterium]|nr:hypothetical protein [Verrucomicrobiae bacterium]